MLKNKNYRPKNLGLKNKQTIPSGIKPETNNFRCRGLGLTYAGTSHLNIGGKKPIVNFCFRSINQSIFLFQIRHKIIIKKQENF